MPTMTLSAKKCVNCHKDVTNGQRMKDSSGRYWCVACGTADQKKKTAALHGQMCAACGERFPAARLTKMGASKICAGCLKKRANGPGSVERPKASIGGGGRIDKGRLIKMLVIMGLLVAGAVWRFATLRG